jgi:hypothetical protein
MPAGHLHYVAVPIGAAGNGINVTIVNDTGTLNAVLTITVVGNLITITPATDGGGVIISTVADVLALMLATPASNALVTPTATVPGTAPPGAVILAGGAGAAIGATRAIGIKIKDWTGKYYMNDYIPLDLIFGFDNSQTPGLLYPEIYIPKNQHIWFDLKGLPSGTGNQIVTLTHKGQKVYA